MTALLVDVKILDHRLIDNPQWRLPEAASVGAAGLDVRAMIDAPIDIAPNTSLLVPTGLSVFIKNPRYVGLLMPRSGLGHKGLVLGNLTGVIDADYQGPLMVSLWNRSTQIMTVNPGDRVAQLLIVPVMQVQWNLVEEFDDATHRGAQGFGHSGTH